MDRGICRLCDRERDLCRSHIIPEVVFGPLYDDKHRAIELTRNPSPLRYRQKGFRYPLLCKDCEGFINDEYEKPFQTSWVNVPHFPQTILKRRYKVTIKDPDVFRLFIYSVLWRAAVCTVLPFADVRLGAHEDALRRKLLTKVAGPIDDYPIAAILPVLKDSREIAPVIADPYREPISGLDIWNLPFGYCIWKVVLTCDDSRIFARERLRADGTMRIPAVDVLEIQPIKNLFFATLKPPSDKAGSNPGTKNEFHL